MGLKGGLVWQIPDPALPLNSRHYEKLWAVAQELGTPINFHILSGFTYFKDRAKLAGNEIVRGAVNTTVMATETGSKAVDAGARQFDDVASTFGRIA